MDEEVFEQMNAYLAIVDGGGPDAIDRLDALYAPEFVNIRFDKEGQAVKLNREQFMGILHSFSTLEGGAATTEWTRIVTTSSYAGCVSVIMLRRKQGQTWSYHFVWQKSAERWQILREFTFHEQF